MLPLYNFYNIERSKIDDFICSSWKYILWRIWSWGEYFWHLHQKNIAEAAKDLVVKKLYEEEVNRDTWIDIKDMSDIEVEILEIESDTAVDIYLGEYVEIMNH